MRAYLSLKVSFNYVVPYWDIFYQQPQTGVNNAGKTVQAEGIRN